MMKEANSYIINIAAFLLVGVLLVHIMTNAQLILLPLAWALFIALFILPMTHREEESSPFRSNNIR